MWLYHKINYQTLFSWKVPIVVSPGYTFACLARCLAVPGSFKSSQMKDTKILQTKNLLLNRPGRQKIKTNVWLTGIGYYKMIGRLCFLLCKQKLKQLAINELSACKNVQASEGVQLVSSNQWFFMKCQGCQFRLSTPFCDIKLLFKSPNSSDNEMILSHMKPILFCKERWSFFFLWHPHDDKIQLVSFSFA